GLVMTRTEAVFGVVAAAAFAASLGARTTAGTQAAASTDRDALSITGCLERDASGAYQLTDAHVDRLPARATGTTGAAATTGATGGTAGRRTAAAGASAGASTAGATSVRNAWKLEPGDRDLDKHVGHRIQVTGREVAASATATAGATGPAGATGTAAGATS